MHLCCTDDFDSHATAGGHALQLAQFIESALLLQLGFEVDICSPRQTFSVSPKPVSPSDHLDLSCQVSPPDSPAVPIIQVNAQGAHVHAQ